MVVTRVHVLLSRVVGTLRHIDVKVTPRGSIRVRPIDCLRRGRYVYVRTVQQVCLNLVAVITSAVILRRDSFVAAWVSGWPLRLLYVVVPQKMVMTGAEL